MNSPFVEWAPSVSAKGLTLYFMSDRPRDNFDVPFGNVRNLEDVNSAFQDINPAISSNGLTLYFGSNRPGGRGDYDIWVAKRDFVDDPFGEPTNLEELNSAFGDVPGDISTDGLVMYFNSERASSGDLYVATRESLVEPFGNVRNLEEINTPFHDVDPTISTDGLTLFWGNFLTFPPGGQGSSDIWMATRPSTDDPFGETINLGPPVNTADGEVTPIISHDWPAAGSSLYFVRGPNNWDIYQATWHLDCNQNGVDDLEDIEEGDAEDLNANDIPDECEPALFRRGDSNADGTVNNADGVSTLSYLFAGNQAPPCEDAADTDDSGNIDIVDAIDTFNWLFLAAAAPALPGHNACGVDPTPADPLGCAAYSCP